VARLVPYPFGALVRRLFRELDERRAIFDLPARRFFLGDQGKEFGVAFHGRHAASPLGPAAGPHTQLAQNIVLAWLGGSRIIELKTVQVLDELTIPRPCINMETVGFNVEWSQELMLHESLEEYVKASMLIDLLVASGRLALAPGFDRTIFDMSVGYNLDGIRGERVQAFIRGMMDATSTVDRLRRQIPDEFRHYRDLDFRTKLSDTLTLSTFHGCPPHEVEAITSFLLREVGLHSVIKLNPMLLGGIETRRLLHDVLGYHDIDVPESAFDRDVKWEQATGMVERLEGVAASLGLGLGVKFTNTLIVNNNRQFFPPSEKEMYLSGPPLHVLAMMLVGRFRQRFGDRIPVSFSAGIDRTNFPDAVALGLTPVTVCTDLLKTGGYGRARGYFQELTSRMDSVGATTIGEFIIRAYGMAGEALTRLDLDVPARLACARALEDGGSLEAASGVEVYRRWVSQAALLNTRMYVERVAADPRYARARHAKGPKKIGRRLRLFDCLSCDKCIPVCPNDANFTFVLPAMDIRVVKVRRGKDGWETRHEGSLAIREDHQIANFADFCNDCGNCDVFCPEDGGPYILKPRFFGSLERWRASPLDGFYLGRQGGSELIAGRFDGHEYELVAASGRLEYAGTGFRVTFDERDPAGTVEGEASGEIDLTFAQIMNVLRKAVLALSAVNYVNSVADAEERSGRSS
jgi:putative selenate reductase